MLGSYVSAGYQTKPTPEAERFFAGLLQWAGVKLPVTVIGTPFEARSTESPEDTVLFLLNHGTEASESTVTLRREAGHYSAIDLATGEPVTLERTADAVSVAVKLAPAGVQVMRITRR